MSRALSKSVCLPGRVDNTLHRARGYSISERRKPGTSRDMSSSRALSQRMLNVVCALRARRLLTVVQGCVCRCVGVGVCVCMCVCVDVCVCGGVYAHIPPRADVC